MVQETLTRTKEQELIIDRVFDAPRETVWKAWTRPEQFARWYGGVNSTLSDVAMDVRPGGGWSAVMHIPGAPDIPWKADYREVLEAERLVFALRNPENLGDPNVEVVTVAFEDVGPKTHMIFRQAGSLPAEEYKTGLKKGWNEFFDRMEGVLHEEQRVRSSQGGAQTEKSPMGGKADRRGSGLKLGMVMIGSAEPKALADFYEKVFARPADYADEGWYGWQFEGASLAIGAHSEVKGKAKEPQRVILNLEAEDVKKEYERVRGLGAVVVKELYEMEGAWIATFADPDGNYFQVVSPWEDAKS